MRGHTGAGTAGTVAGALILLTLAGGAAALEHAKGKLNIELNSLQPSERGCRFTFVVENRLGGDLSKAAFEIAVFNKNGLVDRLTIIDFLDLPEGKTKVRQFDFSGTDCTSVGRVLVNTSTECSGPGIEADACNERLNTHAQNGISFGT